MRIKQVDKEQSPPDSKFEARAGRRSRYPFAKMACDDRVSVEGTIEELRRARSAAHQIAAKKAWQFSTFIEDGVLWVWRQM